MGESAGASAGWASLIGGAADVYSQYQAGQYNKKIANWNASVAEMQAQDAVARGEQQVDILAEKVKQLTGSNRSSYAAQGVLVDSGSAAAVNADTQRQFERDVQQTRLNAAREAWGFKVNAADSRTKGSIAAIEGNQRAAGTLLSTTGRVGTIYAGQGTKVPQSPQKKASK